MVSGTVNKELGLKAMFADVRSIVQKVDTNPEARLALDMFVHCVVKHIGMSLVALPGPVDAIVFTGGIGEHSALIRLYCAKLLQRSVLPKFKLDPERNREEGVNNDGILTVDGASPVCLDIPANVEAVIASDSFDVLDR